MIGQAQGIWTIFCVVLIFVTLIVGFTLRLSGAVGETEPMPLLGIACFFGIGGLVGVFVGTADKA